MSSSSDGISHTVIRASAGTGKTHRLSSRYLQLIDRGYAVDRILATTFTRKAAGEILDRIFERLAKAIESTELRDAMAADLQREELSTERCLELLEHLTRNLHRVRVATLDAFFGQVARVFSLELGLPNDWEILDDHDDHELKSLSLEEMVHRTPANAVQLVHLLVKGEAQRGILQMLRDTADEVYQLYQQAPDPDAWNWLPEPRPLSEDAKVRQFQDFVNLEFASKSMARPHLDAITRVEAEDWENFLGKGLARAILTGAQYHRKDIPVEVVRVYQPMIDRARNFFLFQVARQNQGAFQLAQSFEEVYEAEKDRTGAVLFDDVPRRLLRVPQSSHATQMAYRLDGQVDHLLLDEFQDTAVSQWDALRPLARRVTQSTIDGTSFFCVGDTKQAIYGWRGGQSEILAELDERLPNLHCESLNASRRSSPEIIEAVNQVFLNGCHMDHWGDMCPGFSTWKFERHATLREEPGYVCLETPPEEDELTTPVERAAQLARELCERAPGKSVGILVRKNSTINEVMNALRALGVSASEEGGNPLTDSAAVLHVLALLRFIDHPGDSVARFHFATGPLGRAWQMAPVRGEPAGREDLRLVRRLRRKLVEEGYGKCISDWARVLVTNCSRREALRLSQLVDLAYKYAPRSTLRCRDFVRYVESQRVADPTLADVRVMTIHQSKGLEFDSVILPSLEERFARTPSFVAARDPLTLRPTRVCRYVGDAARSVLPPEVEQTHQQHTERAAHEFLSSLYVAMTRARRGLHMIVSPAKGSNYRKEARGFLMATLGKRSSASAGETLYEQGYRDWYAGDSPPPPPASGKESPALKISLRRRGSQSTRRPPAVSASQRSREFLGDMFRGHANLDAAHAGTLIHDWLSQVTWEAASSVASGESERARNLVKQIRRRVHPRERMDPDHVHPIFERLPDLLAAPSILELFHRPSAHDGLRAWLLQQPTDEGLLFSEVRVDRVEARTEHPIQYCERRQFGQGSIDRLVLAWDRDEVAGAEIIDFKTDDVGERELNAAIERHRDQLTVYRRAISQMCALPLEKIRSRLAFLTLGRVVDV